MNRLLHALYPAAFIAGLAGIAGAGFAASHHHPVALAMTLLIAAVFALGAAELRSFRRAHQQLHAALATIDATIDSTGPAAQPGAALPAPADLQPWLATLPAALRAAVQQRLAGWRVPLPGLTLAPALAGLLVLLGMLGTFIGLVLTLGGTAQALRVTTDLVALRTAFGAPLQGLGLAFSASVAGVTASATLSLMVALARRERSAVAQALDAALLGPLQPFTAAHQRASEQATAAQAAAQRSDSAQRALLAEFRQFSLQIGATVSTQLREHLGAEQARFHHEAQAAYRALAASVDSTLQTGLRTALTDSARLAGEALQAAGEALRPAAEATLAGLAREATALHASVGRQTAELLAAQAAQMARQLDTLHQQAESRMQALAAQTQAAQQAQATADAAQRDRVLQHLANADTARLTAWREALQAAGAQQLAQQQQMAEQVLSQARTLVADGQAQAQATLGEAGTLLKAAGEAPRAAAEMVAALRAQLSQSLAQDQATLAERAALMQTLATLMAALQQAAGEQRAAIDALVQQSATRLEATAERFTAQAEATGHTLAEAATSLAVSAAELGSLGEGFGTAVQQFQAANAQLVQHLGALEERLAGAMTRSDEQLGYYVAQAREVIDLCLGAQKQVLDALQATAHG